MSRQPIDPKDIRKGDLIRNEWPDGTAFEFRAKSDGDNLGAWNTPSGSLSMLAGATEHYLLDRPQPPVILPTEPTLGWVETVNGRWPINVWSHRSGAWLNRGDPSPNVNIRDVTAFTPATAVPTEALDALRSATLLRAEEYDQDTFASLTKRAAKAADRFLAAVGKANEAAR